MKREITIFDVANTFLTYEGMTNKKLQKLCYYAQSWNLALRGERLFDSEFQAWVHGPVSRELYGKYKVYGWNVIGKSEDMPKNMDEKSLEMVRAVYDTYGDFTGDELETLTHSEDPWIEARKGLQEWEATDRVINETTMREYYLASYEETQND